MDKKKILIVDDEIDFLELLKARLEANNYEVVAASNGEAALKEFKDKNPDAVLLDILMPGMDGLEVLRQIRKDNKVVPIFIITAFSNEARFKLASEFDASGFIIKTADLKKELENIAAAINIADKYKKK